MMPENSNPSNGNDKPLRSDENGTDDRLRDISNSDAAAENARESERIQEASQAAMPSHRSDEFNKEVGEDSPPSDEQPLTVQGSNEEIEENLSGTTNLTIEQLKKEGDPGGYSLEGPEPEEESF